MDTTMRAKRTGRYTYSGNPDRMCVCGRRLGAHDAEAPHGFGDLALDPRENLPECDKFRPSRSAAAKAVA